jgi:hypothetical protein
MAETEKYQKLVHLCTRSGAESDWVSANPVLLQGEMGISTRARYNYSTGDEDITILKIGNSRTEWTKLGMNTEDMDDSSVFFAGRGAGILPAAKDQQGGIGHLGGIRLFANERSFHIDESGHLSFRVVNSEGKLTNTTRIEVDEAFIGKLTTSEHITGDVRAGDFIILHDEATTGLGTGYSGIIVAKVSDFDEDNYSTDHGLLIDGNGNWGLATRSRHKYIDSETGEEAESVGAWTDNDVLNFINIVPSNVQDPDNPQPVLLSGTQLLPWTPNTLSLLINNDTETQVIYSPYNVEDGDQVLNIPSLTKITVLTYDSDTHAEIASEEYEIDSSGNLRLELPVPTEASVDAWNKKMTSWTLGENEINDGDQVQFSDSDIKIAKNNTITFPYIKTLTFNGEVVPVSGNAASISPTYTSVSTQANNGIALTETTREDGGKDYRVTHDVYNTTNKPLERTDDIFNISELNMVSDIKTQNGHITEITKTSIGINTLLNKINELERRIAALEN